MICSTLKHVIPCFKVLSVLGMILHGLSFCKRCLVDLRSVNIVYKLSLILTPKICETFKYTGTFHIL